MDLRISIPMAVQGAIALFSFAAELSTGEFYQWIDKDGTVHFSVPSGERAY